MSTVHSAVVNNSLPHPDIPDVLDKKSEKSVKVKKERHLQLAGVVKGVHTHLRLKYQQCPNEFDQVWSDHCCNDPLLEEYAEAMHSLATEIWTKEPQTRIDWCHKTCMEYFYGGGQKKALAKDERRRMYEEQRLASNAETVDGVRNSEDAILSDVQQPSTGIPAVTKKPSCTQSKDKESRVEIEMPRTFPANLLESEENGLGITTEVGITTQNLSTKKEDVNTSNSVLARSRLRLLDVGSCFNPFSVYDEYQSLAVDISPAVQSVYKCDFLNLEVTTTSHDTAAPADQDSNRSLQNKPDNSPNNSDQTQHEREHVTNLTDHLKSESNHFATNTDSLPLHISHLPAESFHIIVFSLLLEYFPSPYHRWLCCYKAHQLLLTDGLLIIITPDSHHQNRNAPMMKSWKNAIESLGFRRWRYEKLEHLHCMAFRKVQHRDCTTEVNSDSLYIPQDLRERKEDTG